MRIDSIKKYLIPNIPYLFIGWACLKLGTAYRLAEGADLPHKLMGLGQTVGQLMGQGVATNSIEVEAPKLFDRVARKWNVDYAFYQTEPGKYLLFFKSGQADAMTACFSEYSRKVLDKAKSRQPTIPEQMKQAEQQLAKEKPPKEHIKEVAHDR